MIRALTGVSARRPWAVVALWLVVVGAGFGIGTGVFGRLVPDVGTVPGSESYKAAQRLEEAAPRPETLNAVITGRPANDPELRRQVAAAVAATRTVPGVTAVSEPLPSAATGRALLVQVRLAPGDGEEAAAEAAAARLRAVDAQVTVAGGPLSDAEFDEQAGEDVARAEMLSTPVVLVLLLIVFGGLLAAGLPLLVAVVGTGGAFGILFAFSAVTDISVYAVQIVTMLALGLAVDYALLMVSRFREERRTAPDVATAVARTSATAGRTVAFSGLTVMVALAGLVVFPDPFLRSMGLAGAAVVAVDMLVALTLLPALLSRFGHRIRPRRREGRGQVFARVARGVQRRPVAVLVAIAAVMVTLAVPVFGMRIAMGDPRMLPDSTDTRQMWDGLNEHFPDQVQWAGDIQVVTRIPANDPRIAQLRQTVSAMPGVTDVEAGQLAPGLTVITATPTGQAEGADARNAVAAIRDLPLDVQVTGDTARLVDYRAMLADRLPWAIALVAVGTLLLLFAFTGSVVLPVKAVLTNLLSIGAALGAVVWVFQDGNLAGLMGTEGMGYVHLTVPVLVGAIAFGLSVDYEVFLLSRIRERALAGDDPQVSVAAGIQSTGGIVTAAALLIGVVFAGFAAGGFAPIKAIGLGLVLAIALDATLVRMLLVPATMTLMGRLNWWLPAFLRPVHKRLAISEEPPPEPTPSTTQEPVPATR
ncbi:putative membrane protein [Actinomadura sp. NBRC 104412]|uniref:MMPL family transporter n=1 Tax=Actinomadura sp. NBRC 104412 TaxID=3032203 RepID=UPI0024A3935F|nr:MMPL family transporter [Actinomadura sp. NBRC 104412]GLZ05547.1 putative membrane protein [Actinomadura sp. NBRC 104412]